MFRDSVKERINTELEQGEAARRDGYEGRARVCARRAAGAAIREYLVQIGQPPAVASAYDLIAFFQTLPDLTPEMRAVSGHLMDRVDETFSLPADVDLLAETRWLAQTLEAALS